MGIFRREKKFSIEDFKTISEIVEEKKGKSTRSGSAEDFFDKMSKYKEFEKKMLQDKDIEIEEIVKRYSTGEDSEGGEVEDVAIKQLMPLLSRFLNKSEQKPPISASSEQGTTQTTLNKKPDLLATPELVEIAKDKIFSVMPKKYKSKFREEISQLSDNDIINLKRSIENDEAN